MSLPQILISGSLGFVFIALLGACGGGSGSRIDYDKACRESHDPLDTEPGQNQQKVGFDDSLSEVPPGNYVYQGAEVFIKDPKINEAGNFALHVLDSKDRVTEEFGGALKCARGVSTGIDVSYTVKGYSKMVVEKSGKFDAETRVFEVGYDLDGLLIKNTSSGATQEKPSKLYKSKEGVETQLTLIRENNTDFFQIRSIDTYADGLVIKLVTKFKREDLPQAAELASQESQNSAPKEDSAE